MKIAKEKLKNLIKEELARFEEAELRTREKAKSLQGDPDSSPEEEPELQSNVEKIRGRIADLLPNIRGKKEIEDLLVMIFFGINREILKHHRPTLEKKFNAIIRRAKAGGV